MTREMYFSIAVILGLLTLVSYVGGVKFRESANEIIQIYNALERYLVRNSKWKEPIRYNSKFYDVQFQTSKEAIEIITIMIRDAIKCFNQQNGLVKLTTENLLSELKFIQRKLYTIYTFS